MSLPVRPAKSQSQLLNMNMGFLGIQFGWSLQMANMSSIYEKLGAQPEQLSFLWLAAPLTGLLVQPIVGYCSDRTWGPLGRRRPYFLAGAVLSCLGLIGMPHAATLGQAATLLWILDASINISMEPFRAFVADLLPAEQRPKGYATQSLLIGLGSIIAYALPFLMSKLSLPDTGSHQSPNVTWSFYLGALAFFSAVLWTVFTTPEYPPEAESSTSDSEKVSSVGNPQLAQSQPVSSFPPILLRLAPVQFFTWLGLFSMWTYFTVCVSNDVFGALNSSDPLSRQGADWAGVCYSFQSLITFLFSMVLPRLATRFGSGMVHGVCLVVGACGLFSVPLIHTPYPLLGSMGAVGVAWASILSLPYAMLSRQLRAGNTGLWMGIFNGCIVLPEILNALCFGWLMTTFLGNSRAAAVAFGGCCLLFAGLLSLILLRKDAVDS